MIAGRGWISVQASLQSECWQPLPASWVHLDLDVNVPNWSLSQNKEAKFLSEKKYAKTLETLKNIWHLQMVEQ